MFNIFKLVFWKTICFRLIAFNLPLIRPQAPSNFVNLVVKWWFSHSFLSSKQNIWSYLCLMSNLFCPRQQKLQLTLSFFNILYFFSFIFISHPRIENICIFHQRTNVLCTELTVAYIYLKGNLSFHENYNMIYFDLFKKGFKKL